jgi:hypothetical protein
MESLIFIILKDYRTEIAFKDSPILGARGFQRRGMMLDEILICIRLCDGCFGELDKRRSFVRSAYCLKAVADV